MEEFPPAVLWIVSLSVLAIKSSTIFCCCVGGNNTFTLSQSISGQWSERAENQQVTASFFFRQQFYGVMLHSSSLSSLFRLYHLIFHWTDLVSQLWYWRRESVGLWSGSWQLLLLQATHLGTADVQSLETQPQKLE